ncbi:hypothetical protein K449DRAFT_126681 [Hypoxylon sp. EC38]|nr:hypothetical protein K449DRAFT_126681 [Hypoxylon sp. EC38]
MSTQRARRITLSTASGLIDIESYSKRQGQGVEMLARHLLLAVVCWDGDLQDDHYWGPGGGNPALPGPQKEVKRDGVAVSYTQDTLSGSGVSSASLIDAMRKLAKKRETTVQKQHWVVSLAAM